MKRTLLAAILAALPCVAFAADEASNLDAVVVTGKRTAERFRGDGIDSERLVGQRAATSDSASLLRDIPGVSLYGAGGVSSLPAIHGMADDRLRIKVDGMDLIASCPNHMNPALSYLDPSNVDSLKVYAGIAPVSVGGDSIGGTIVAESLAPEFAAPGQGSLVKGQAGAFYRSNSNASGASLSASRASETLSISYSGALAEAGNYTAGREFMSTTATGRLGHTLPLDEVGSTAYKTRNHQLGIALKSDNHIFEARLGYQDIPYELYPNQRMDMLGNTAQRLNLRYLGQYDWGTLEARAYHETVKHHMDFGEDKKFTYGAAPALVAPGMPMDTESRNTGATIKAGIDLGKRDTLRLGGELQSYRLDDWWPPSPDCGTCLGGMAPNTFWNINNGKRDRTALFAEWESRIAPPWVTQIGARYEQVRMDAGAVQGYNTVMYAPAAFNAANRKRADSNWDLTALARYSPDKTLGIEFGYARKTRSPNLYERYSWSTNAMALEMNNFVGDGNGYVGDPYLKPEKADTLSASFDWHAPDRAWEFKATPYYTQVADYIDAKRLASSVANLTTTNQFVRLQYVNQSARLHGLDLSGHMALTRNGWGEWSMKGLLNYTRGRNRDTGDNLYNIMPLNAKLTLTQKLGAWDNGIELVMVKQKDAVSAVRNEVRTPGYGLINLRGSHSWKQARIDFGVENLFDRHYYLPLGGAYTGQGATMSLNREVGVIGANGGTASLWGTAVPGMGRSLYAGVTFKF